MNEFDAKAERAVVACMITENPIIGKALKDLEQKDFSDPACRDVFEVIRRMVTDGEAVDYLTVAAKCREYAAQIAQWCTELPTASNWSAYVRIVAENAKRARAAEGLQRLWQSVQGGEGLEACQSKAAELCEVLGSTEEEKTLSAADGYLLFCENMQTPKVYLKTGIWTVDKHLYIDRGDYIVVGGRPSSGKTAFTLQMMLHLAQSRRAAYFSLETSGAKIFDRLLANYARISLTDIKQGRVGKGWEKIAEAGEAFTRLDFKVVEAAGWTVDQIRAKAVQLKSEVIFIDYIGLVRGEGRSLYEQVTQVSNSLHIMAQQTKITAVALSQLSREGKGEPDMTHLRESGAIEQDADAVLLLHQTDWDKPHERKLIIAKNKEGQTGQVFLNFNGEYQRFTPVEGTKHPDGTPVSSSPTTPS